MRNSRHSGFGTLAVTLAATILLPATPSRAAAVPAEAFVRGKIDEFADLIQSGLPKRFDTLRTRVRQIADFDSFAKQALGAPWATASATERQQFKDAMQGLLESHYMSKPSSVFDKEKITISGATPSGTATVVTGAVKRKDVDINFLVKIEPDHDQWRVLDVTIDGLSLLEDYRSQFQSYLKKKTLAQLITRLHDKAEANMKSAAPADAPAKP